MNTPEKSTLTDLLTENAILRTEEGKFAPGSREALIREGTQRRINQLREAGYEFDFETEKQMRQAAEFQVAAEEMDRAEKNASNAQLMEAYEKEMALLKNG